MKKQKAKEKGERMNKNKIIISTGIVSLIWLIVFLLPVNSNQIINYLIKFILIVILIAFFIVSVYLTYLIFFTNIIDGLRSDDI